MNENELRAGILEVFAQVAPEADIANIKDELNFRDQFEFDSVDFLGFATGLEKRFGVKISEYDYPKLSSLAGCLRYLAKT